MNGGRALKGDNFLFFFTEKRLIFSKNLGNYCFRRSRLKLLWVTDMLCGTGSFWSLQLKRLLRTWNNEDFLRILNRFPLPPHLYPVDKSFLLTFYTVVESVLPYYAGVCGYKGFYEDQKYLRDRRSETVQIFTIHTHSHPSVPPQSYCR